MNGPLAIFRQPHPGALLARQIFRYSLLARARLRRHRCPNHSSSRRYFSSLLSHRAPPPLVPPNPPLYIPLPRSALRKEGPRMGNEGVIDGIRVTQSTPPPPTLPPRPFLSPTTSIPTATSFSAPLIAKV